MKWTDEEDDYLRANYNSIPFAEISKVLTHRSESSIRWRAAHILGVTTPKANGWSEAEIALITSGESIGKIVAETGRTYTAVNKKRNLILAQNAISQLKKDQNYSEIFDLSVIKRNIPIVSPTSKSANHRALLLALKVGDSYEFPSGEYGLVRNQITLLAHRIYTTKKWTQTSRRVWRIK